MPSSTFIRTVSTTTRLAVSRPSTNALKFARFPRPSPILRSFPQRRYNSNSADTGSAPEDPPAPKRSRLSRTLGLLGTTSFVCLTLGLGIASGIYDSTKKLMATAAQSDEETLTAYEPTDELSRTVDEYIHNHPLTLSLRDDPEYTESRPYLKIPEKIRARSLTAGTLSNSDGIVVPPVVFNNKTTNTLVSIFYLGPNVSGHPGIVHGGFLATLLDEGMGRCAFPVLPTKVGVTANLNVDYRRPAMAESYFVMHAQVVKHEGRKAWVEARIETLPEEGQEPQVLVEAKSLFIEPKMAAAIPGLPLHKFTT
ncbi:PaaI family thioesterase [Aspergillus stella-maris]|uniref:PaaI family thioesterase n=1 Tax=Aspergillus stella-maris TaxID=1810926 RepID=UPI003CCD0C64